ncbi:MAG: hypothetical protein ACLFR1_07730 [Spirochaetia bacterium]
MKKLYHNLLWLLKGVQVYGLIGKSGTGKSFRAKLVARKFNIDLIIDDGLLIRNQKIIAGKSAKKENAYLAAIKTALFDDKEHKKEVRDALDKEKFKRILIIGTSERMVKKIDERLGLPAITRNIHIEEVASKEEIETAMHSRQIEGKHVIPVPAIEVKRDYPHIFYDSVKIFLKKNLNLLKKASVFEKTVVRPEYKDQRGKVAISEAALAQMILHCVDEFNHTIEVKKISVKTDNYGYKLKVAIGAPFGTQLSGNIHDLQEYIMDNIERYTGIMVDSVEIIIAGISEPSDFSEKSKEILQNKEKKT